MMADPQTHRPTRTKPPGFPLRLFRFIHHHLPVLCLVDAAIGYSIGNLFGHGKVGAVIGAAISVFNYFVVNRLLFREVLK